MRLLMAEGVTTLEIKSGYGLSLHDDILPEKSCAPRTPYVNQMSNEMAPTERRARRCRCSTGRP
jgi:hypothetical protein